jgi:hypothetical protein
MVMVVGRTAYTRKKDKKTEEEIKKEIKVERSFPKSKITNT